MSELKKSMTQSKITSKSTTEISINSILVWIFYFEQNIVLDEYSEKRITNLYGIDRQFLNPNIRPGELFSILRQIDKKRDNLLIKICFHWKCIDLDILNMLNKKMFNIVEIYILAENSDQVSKLDVEFGSKIITNLNLFYVRQRDIKTVIDTAQSQVQYFTKAFRTNYNSVSLTGEQKSNEIIKRYRFRLISLINLKRSDEEKADKEFIDFAEKRFTQMKYIEQTQTGKVFNSIIKRSLFDDLFQKYKEAVQKYRQERKRLEQIPESNKQQKQKLINENNQGFWETMVEIYQDKGFFYQILNRNLRIISQDSMEKKWTALAQPFSFLYQSLKSLHLLSRKKDPQFYEKVQENYVFRGGRIRLSQIMDILKATIKMNNHSQKDQMQIVENIFRGKRPLKSFTKALFLEFYGFLSTSTDLDIVLNKFMQQISQKDQNYDLSADYRCIFKIKIKNNQNIYRPQFSHLLHGFYKFEKNKSQVQVLFNALNVFKLVGINRKTIVDKKLYDFDQQNGKQKDLVFEIELQYGSFFDFILDKNNEKLSQKELLVKKSYCYCYNKIKKTDQFDIGDAHETLNQLKQSQRYFESKVIQGTGNQDNEQNDKFQISKLDNKNYFLRLSQIYDNRGRTSKAIQYARLSIQCYKHMENAQQHMLFIKHMQRLFEMQKRIIDFLQRVSDSLQMQKETEKQMKEISQLEKGKNHPSFLIRTSQLNLKKGVLRFERGNIDESKESFLKCENSIKDAFERVNCLKQDSFKKQFLKNLFCCSKYQFSCIWSYQKFQQQVKKSLGLDHIESKKQDLQKIAQKAVSLSHYAGEAITDRIKAYKNKHQYKSIIEKFRQAATLNLSMTQSQVSEEPDLLEKSDNELLSIIQSEIIKIKQQQKGSSEYQKRFQAIKDFIKQYSLRKNLTIYQGNQAEVQDDFIHRFLKKERENRLQWLQFNKNKTISQTIINFQSQFNSMIAEIEHTIDQLKNDCVSEYNSKIVSQRGQLALIAWNSSNYELALKQIQLIVEHGSVQGEEKQLQLAKAYKIKGKISLKSQNYEQAIEQAEKSLDYHMSLIEKTQKQEKQKKRRTQKNAKELIRIHPEPSYPLAQQSRHQINQHHQHNEEEDQLIRKDRFSLVTNIQMNNQFIESTLLRCKAKLYFIHQAKKKIELQKSVREKQKLISQLAEHTSLVKDLISQLSKVIQKRKQKLELSELQVEFPQIEGLNKLINNQNPKQLKEAFLKFYQSMKLRNTLYSEGNTANFTMYAEIISNFASKPEIYSLIEENGFFSKIEEFYNKIKEKSNVRWKIQKAMYLKQKYNPKKQQKEGRILQKKYLEDSISTIITLNDFFLARQAHQLQLQLKWYDPSYILWTQKTQAQEIVFKQKQKRQSQIMEKLESKPRFNSAIIGKLPSLKPPKLQYVSQLQRPIDEEDQKIENPNQVQQQPAKNQQEELVKSQMAQQNTKVTSTKTKRGNKGKENQ